MCEQAVVTDVGPSQSLKKPAVDAVWQRSLNQLVLDRNEAELGPSQSLFRSYAALYERVRRLQCVELEREALLESNEKLQARVRELEGIAADSSARTAREVELAQKTDRLQAKVEAYMEQENEYYRGMAALNTWRERAEVAEGRISTLEEDLSRRTSELGLVKKAYVSLRDEVELLRDKAMEAEQRAHDLDAARRRIRQLTDELARRGGRGKGKAGGEGAGEEGEENPLGGRSSPPLERPSAGVDPTRPPTRVGCRIDAAHPSSVLRAVAVAKVEPLHFFTAGSDKTIGVWDLTQGRASLLKSLASRGMVLGFDTASHYLLAGCADHVVRFWNTTTMRSLELAGHGEKVVSVGLASTAQHAVSASSDHTLKLWDIRRREVLRTSLVESTCNDVVVLDDTLVSAHYNGSLITWDHRTGARTCELANEHQGPATCVRVSPDGRLCVSLGKDNTLIVRDTRVFTQTLRSIRPPQLTVTSNWTRFAISPNAPIAAVGNNRGQVLLLALTQGVEDALMPGVRATRSSGNGVNELVLSVLEGGHEKTSAVHGVAWTTESPSRLISIGEDRRLIVWE